MSQAAIRETVIPELRLINRGKVRDIYDLGDRLLFVATDRISAFDFVLGTPIPDKGKILAQITLFWLDYLQEVIPNHLITTDLAEFKLSPESAAQLVGRSMVVKKAQVLPVECIVRGYLIGSGWKEYQAHGTVCGIELPAGLKMAARLPEPLFTPSTKAEQGLHDENITPAQARQILGDDVFAQVSAASLKLYTRAAEHALRQGIIIADTKFEFGLLDGRVILIDEVLTPDSSRFWPADQYQTGISPPSFDKQFVRDWLEKESGWNKQPPAPALPQPVVDKTGEKYREAYRRLTGRDL